MIQSLRTFIRLLSELRQQEADQRKYLRAIYARPSRWSTDYERPACMRRHPLVTSC